MSDDIIQFLRKAPIGPSEIRLHPKAAGEIWTPEQVAALMAQDEDDTIEDHFDCIEDVANMMSNTVLKLSDGTHPALLLATALRESVEFIRLEHAKVCELLEKYRAAEAEE